MNSETFPFAVEFNKPLSQLSTMKVGGIARIYTEVETIPQMQIVMRYCGQQRLRFLIVGKGSNTLFDDHGFDGLIIGNRILFFEQRQPNQFYVGAGYSFSRLGTLTARKGWTGLEFASGIPGSVGGAVFMNAGANGCETSTHLTSADYINLEGELQTFTKQEMIFGYRYSSFQQMPGALVAALFTLHQDPSARKHQLEIINYRKETQPYQEPSVGCIFCNPTGRSAGALIEQAGLKGTKIGGARVSEQHANFIVNSGNACSNDVLCLMELVKEKVRQTSGIELQSEVRIIPYNSQHDKD